MRTQVAIIGAGPAGLTLAHLLHMRGISSVVIENRSRAYVEQRVRAGVLEHGTVDLFQHMGVADRLLRERLLHHGIELRFEGRGYRMPLTDLTGGRAITIYGQQEVVKDLIHARIETGAPILFDASDTTLHGLTSASPRVRFWHGGERHEVRCDFVAGCDGGHGVSRAAFPSGAAHDYDMVYPFAWLGILAAAPPASDEIVYANHERGFALQSMRSAHISRLYLQIPLEETVESWPDERIWQELAARLATDGDGTLNQGPILEKSVTPLRSFVREPMQHGRLFLAGDAAHIVPPTGAKGLNLAVADARVLATAIIEWYQSGRTDLLAAYSSTCLRRVWRAEHFSWWMTWMLHRHEQDGGFARRLQLSQLRYLCSSTAAATSLAENYVGLEAV